MLAIDLGSNSLRVLEYDCASQKVLKSFEKAVKTADGLAATGEISSQAVIRIVTTLKEAQKQIDFNQPIKAVTTQALRSASNQAEVLESIAEQTAVRFEVIDPKTEATLTLQAVKYRLDVLQTEAQSFVMLDIGGASTELAFWYGETQVLQSFELGIVTLAQRYEDLQSVREAMPKEVADIANFCTKTTSKHGKAKVFVATAGTPTTVAAMKLGLNAKTYDASKVNGTTLAHEELAFYLDKLTAMSPNERELAVGTGRSDLIQAGILIYEAIFDLLGFLECVVVDDGLREGVALAWCKEHSNLS